MTLVYADALNEPGLHALVVGVGSYADALGADSAALRSAPNSALAMAQWLKNEYRSFDLPLRSLEMLVSPVDPKFDTRAEFSGKTVERAFMGQAKPQGPFPAYGLAKAVHDWKERATGHQANGTLFYFCGHGVQFQGVPHLLLEGFDPTSDAPFDAALNVQEFWLGMEMCLARTQIYVVDACRDVPSWLLAKQNASGGRRLVELDVDALPIDLGPRNAPIFYGASSMQRAGSSDGVISRFTKAFIEVMRGPACMKPSDSPIWRVSTDRIIVSIRDLRKRALWGDWGRQEPMLGGESSPFEFHVPEKPTVPLLVSKPGETNKAQVKVDGEGCVPLNATTWFRDVPIGKQVVSAESPQGSVASVEVFVKPIYEEVKL